MVIRRDGDEPRIALVHRPRYDDWSLPKGKLDEGEAFDEAALREVREETGVSCALGTELSTSRYRDRHGRPKVVRWWSMAPADPVDELRFEPNDEVDELRWCTPSQVATLASYEPDVALVAEALGL